MRLNILFLFSLILFTASCNQKPTIKKFYRSEAQIFNYKKSNITPTPGSFCLLDMTTYVDNQLFEEVSTGKEKEPIVYPIPPNFVRDSNFAGVVEALSYMTVGDSATVKTEFLQQELSSGLNNFLIGRGLKPPFKLLIENIKLLRVMNESEYNKYMEEQSKKQTTNTPKDNNKTEELVKQMSGKIDLFKKDKLAPTNTTDNGIKIHYIEPLGTNMPKQGNICEVDFIQMDINGNLIMSTFGSSEPIKVTLDSNTNLTLYEILSRMSLGGKTLCFVPDNPILKNDKAHSNIYLYIELKNIL